MPGESAMAFAKSEMVLRPRNVARLVTAPDCIKLRVNLLVIGSERTAVTKTVPKAGHLHTPHH
jgi:hypothetical protein